MGRIKLLAAVVVVWAFVGVSAAQEGDFRAVENPFQDEFDYEVNTDLNPSVEVDGVRWLRFGVYIKEGREIDSTKDNPITFEIDLLNTSDNSAKVTVIALLEDASGTPLDKVECKIISVGSDRTKNSVQKFRLHGLVLEATRKIYLFFEVQN